jgi:exodeoxyribonuclease VII large subunit
VPEERRSERREREIFRVGELIRGLNALLEDRVGRVWVLGEISNLHRARSGHCYFTLKDSEGQVRAALFRSAAARVPFEIEEGLEVLVYAEVGIYAARGDLQLIVRQVEPRGLGGLQLAFEQLRRRLEAEGLFDEERKRSLPELPQRVGVVTSPTSAALRDVIQITGRRFPAAVLLVVPTRVQGEAAADEIAAALDLVARQPKVQVVLLVRGGGSLEDLWAFNTEVVARAIERCPVPVVSGVGHEVDVTIADLVADLRASTPSAAAELVLPDRHALLRELQRDWRRLCGATRVQLRRMRSRLDRERDALKMLAPSARLAAQRSRLVALQRGLRRAMETQLEARRAGVSQLAGRLHSLSPLAVLSRGYALVRDSETGLVVRRASDLTPGDRLSIRLAQGELEAAVGTIGPVDV